MATASRPSSPPSDPDRIATALQEASLVRILTPTYGGAIAAAGLMARALAQRDVPFQVAPTTSRTERVQRRTDGDEEATTILIGDHDQSSLSIDPRRPVEAVTAVLSRIDADPAPVLALAGLIAAGKQPQALPELRERAQERGMTQQLGVGIPTAAYADGLTHSLLFHATFSGDREAVIDHFTALGIEGDTPVTEAERRAVASLVAIEATGDGRAPSAVRTVERALRPHTITGPFATVEGYGDVLALVSECQPGLAVAIALGSDLTETALSVWHEQAAAVHECLHSAPWTQYEDCLLVPVSDAPPRSVARLTQEVYSTESMVLAVGPTTAAIATDEDIDALALAAELGAELELAYDGTARVAHLEYTSQPATDELIETVQVVR